MPESPRITLTPEELLEHSGWVQKLARHLLPSSELAEDAVQDTWLAAIERPPQTRESVGGWLRTVVRHAAQRLDRREAARRRRELATWRDATVPSAADLVERAQGQRLVAGVVLELPEPYRSTLLLRYFEGLTLAEIARRTEVPEGTVRAHHHRALREVRERLAARGHVDPDALRSTAAFLAGVSAASRAGATAGTAAIGALVMTTKAKIGMAAVLVLSLICGWAWWRGWRAGEIEPAPTPAAPAEKQDAAPATERRDVPPQPLDTVSAAPARFSRVKVVAEDGSGIAQAVVIAADRPRTTLAEPGYQVLGLTDANGSLLVDIASLPPSFITLSAHHPAFVPAVERRPDDGGDVAFTLRAGEAAVFDCQSRGKPVPGVVLRLSRSSFEPRKPEEYAPVPEGILALPGSAGRRNLFTAASDESGRAVVTGLPRGKYILEIECLHLAPNFQPDLIEIPQAGPMLLDLAELWVWALDVDTTAPDVLAWKHPGRRAGPGAPAVEGRHRQRLRRRWPNRIIDVTAFVYPGGAPPDMNLDVLHPRGVSRNRVRAVRLSDFTGPQPEAPITPTDEPTGSSIVTIRVIDPDGEPVEGFAGYTVQKVGFSPFQKDQWIRTFDPASGANRCLEGDYEVHPAGTTSKADFDVVRFHAGTEPTVEVTLKLKRRLRPVRIVLLHPPFAEPVPGWITINVKDTKRGNLWWTGALERPPWLPVGEPLEFQANSFGSLSRVVPLTIGPGNGVLTLPVELEDEPDR